MPKYKITYADKDFEANAFNDVSLIVSFLKATTGTVPYIKIWDKELRGEDKWTDYLGTEFIHREKIKQVTHKDTWKKFEREVAGKFGAFRTPLSGMAEALTKADIIHDVIFAECKLRGKDKAFLKIYDKLFKKKKAVAKVGEIYLMFWKEFENLIETPDVTLNKFKLFYKIVELKSKTIVNLYDKTLLGADKENKIPIIALRIKSKQGFLIGFELENLRIIADEYRR